MEQFLKVFGTNADTCVSDRYLEVAIWLDVLFLWVSLQNFKAFKETAWLFSLLIFDSLLKLVWKTLYFIHLDDNFSSDRKLEGIAE